jgi:hypothetical protein
VICEAINDRAVPNLSIPIQTSFLLGMKFKRLQASD